ncbi:MAG: cyclic nucleotide-binding domain-containing protein [Candidatus Sericytochromatia bacterium]
MAYDLFIELLFEDFSEDELKELLLYSQKIRFSSGDYIFKEGDISDSIYIIFTGRIEVTTKTENKDKINLPIVLNGTVLGEIAFFDGKPRTASARAIDNIEAMMFTHNSFEKMEDESPKIAIKFLKEIAKITAERLRWADEKVKELIDNKDE